ncbi:hypothetical protein C660_07049 [Alcaligenes sp. HPC1271]|uniref:helix-turn-helix domain-containing protein n=1 Tax=Alcaligenes sp. EGD-AK7 TaxID=1386079 RepID=UPI0002AA7627|nr:MULTISPECIES: helix-turn-helix domain-containing protein [unclassified Alcaligenes]EKU30760.1 hypothetical protein C660_07049 [Alcaligenes sp. HPC1271]
MRKKNAPATSGNESKNITRNFTKQAFVLELLRSRSLNRFEAEQYGDHCLPSTISSLRAAGHCIHDEWENIHNRFGGYTRVKRYVLIQGGMNG